jgi:hypothetical protein
VACSDGRLQEAVDEFLDGSLGISHYDRLYLPGGPGSLSAAGIKFMRGNQVGEELQFLIEAHQIEQVILIYHGPASDGPADAICADYRRIYPAFDPEGIRKQQEIDTEEIIGGPLAAFPANRVRAFRLEVDAAHSIAVVPLI